MHTNNNYRKGFDDLNKVTYRCPQCNVFVSKEDNICWACKKDIEPVKSNPELEQKLEDELMDK